MSYDKDIMAQGCEPVQGDRMDGRLRGVLIKLSLAGGLAVAALFLIFHIVQYVAAGSQEISKATLSLELLQDIENSVVTTMVPRGRETGPAVPLAKVEEDVLARFTELRGLNPQDGSAALATLQGVTMGLLNAVHAMIEARPNGALLEAVAPQRAAFGTALQEATSEQQQIAQEGLSGLVKQTRFTVFAIVFVLAATVFLLTTVLVTGFKDMKRREEVERELRAAVQKANEASLAKSAFLATVTHELRTPLNAILGYSELLNDEPLGKDQKKQVSRLSVAGQTLSRIVDDVLDLSRIEAGAMEMRDETFCPRELVKEAIDLVSVDACAKGLVLSSEVAQDVPKLLRGDPLRLSQVLLNLLNNAIKFTPEGFVTLRMTARMAAGDVSQLRVEVQDSGIGISIADQDHLFQRFSQMENGVSEYQGGSGLGLSISQGLIEQMGGRISVFSRQGEGTIFWFHVELPVVESDTADEPPAAAGDDPQPPLRDVLGKVILIDDSDDTADLLQRILQREGVALFAVPDTVRSLENVVEHAPDVILCDMQMPNISGDELIRCIRALPKPFGDTPIIAFSATTMKSDIEDMLMAGADGFLAKPFKASDVTSAIAAVVSSRAEAVDVEEAPKMRVAETPDELDDIVDLMGPDWALKYVERLSDRLERYFEGIGDKSEQIGLAHSVVSEAGQLGMRDLAWAASSLEQALRADGRTLREEAKFCSEARQFLSRLPLYTSHIRQAQ